MYISKAKKKGQLFKVVNTKFLLLTILIPKSSLCMKLKKLKLMMSLSLGRLHMILTNVYPVESAYAQKDDSKNLKLPHNYILLCEFIALSKISEKELF